MTQAGISFRFVNLLPAIITRKKLTKIAYGEESSQHNGYKQQLLKPSQHIPWWTYFLTSTFMLLYLLHYSWYISWLQCLAVGWNSHLWETRRKALLYQKIRSWPSYRKQSARIYACSASRYILLTEQSGWSNYSLSYSRKMRWIKWSSFNPVTSRITSSAAWWANFSASSWLWESLSSR